jgi:hypothetical protein
MPRSDVACRTATAPPMPTDFESWHAEISLIADQEGCDLFFLAWMYSPAECCDYLASLPGELERLIARARWADRCAEICGQHRRVS